MPPKLPQEHDAETHKKEAALLGLVGQLAVDFAQKVSTSVHEDNAKKIWWIISKMLNEMCSIHATSTGGVGEEQLKRALERMKVDGQS